MAVNSSASLAALCNKKVSVIGLSAPFAVARELALPNKAVPLAAHFSPHLHQASFLASHAGQSVFLFNLNDARAPLQATLPHQRNVRSVAWSLFDSNVVATCAADNAIHLWDMRDLKSPKASSTFKVFTAGISAVKWNKHNANLLASSHDIQVEIWDIRRSAPVTFITAHPTKISSIDWSPAVESDLITSSADGTVKMWDVKKSRICQGTLQTGSPVAKAMYAPSGQALVVLNAPPNLHARVWSLRHPLGTAPALELSGNKDLCPDMAACERLGSSSRDIVSWSRDAHLCIWELPEGNPSLSAPLSSSLSSSFSGPSNSLGASAPSSFAHSPLSFAANPLSPGPRSSSSSSSRDSAPPTPAKQQLHSLRDELDDVEHSPIEGMTTESQIAALTRQVIARTSDAQGRAVAIKIAFPSLYPHNASPSFEFLLPETRLPTDVMVSLLASLQSLCRRATAQSHYCLRPALMLLRKSVLSEEVLVRKRGDSTNSNNNNSGNNNSSGSNNRSIASSTPPTASSSDVSAPSETPCPRLSGATFSPSGRLVHFTNNINFTVRTYSELRNALSGSVAAPSSSRLLQSPADDSALTENLIQPVVTHYHLPHVSQISPELAKRYRLLGRPVKVLCAENAEVALKLGLTSIARAWRSLSAIAESCDAGALPLQHTLARPLVQQILSHFEAASDIQTVACMSRVLLSVTKPVAAATAPHPSSTPRQAPSIASQVDRHMRSMKTKPKKDKSNPSGVLPVLQQPQLALHGASNVSGGVGSAANESGGVAVPGDSKVWTKRLFQKTKLKRADSDPPVPNMDLIMSGSSNFLISSPPASSVVSSSVVASQQLMQLSQQQQQQHQSQQLQQNPQHLQQYSTLFDSEKCLIEPAMIPKYLALHTIYGDLCLYFSLFSHRAQILKSPLRMPPLLPSSKEAVSGGKLSFEPTCLKCSHNMVNTRTCSNCNIFLYNCALCRLPVGGLYSVCAFCGHGGHTKTCMIEWFSQNDTCPSQGCSCRCSQATK